MNNANKNLVIALLAILSVGSIGYIGYDKLNSDNNNNDNDNIVENEEEQYKLEDFTKIVNEELGFLKSKKNLKDLTNEEKTYMLFSLLENRDNITINKLEDIRKNSSLREMEVEYTDLLDTNNGYQLLSTVTHTLNKDTGEYAYNIGTGRGGTPVWSRPFLTDFVEKDNQYILSYKYAFTRSQGDGPTDLDLYYSLEDALNKKNIIKTFLLRDASENFQELNWKIDTYLNDNYDSIKAELDTYNYVFEVKEGNIILVDFYRN